MDSGDSTSYHENKGVNIMPKNYCECADLKCPVHKGESHCDKRSSERLYRVDMQDLSGTRFCKECKEDAYESGLFKIRVRWYQ